MRDEVVTQEGALPDPDQLGLLDRLSDRCSPILVREVQQALSGRAFLLTLSSSVAVVVVFALVVALTGEDDAVSGREAFAACIACIAPILILIVPMQSFANMRQEVSGGTAEQLLMTRLRPSRIVFGKTLAGLTQFVLFLGVFAPLMAMTFLLRGVDVPTIGIVMLFAVLASIAANVFAIAMASVGGSKMIQQLMLLLTAGGLMVLTFVAMVGAYELLREIGSLLRGPDFWTVLLSVVGAFVVGIWLFGMITTASLAHEYENRSSPFRAFAVGVLLVLAGWILGTVEARYWDDAAPIVSAMSVLWLTPFWLWAACEEPRMSPRVKTLVPRRGWLAALAVPFLPGGGRGMAFGLLLAAVGVGVGCGLPLIAGVGLDRRSATACGLAWLYVPIVAGMARTLRGRLPRGRRFSWITFSATLASLFALSMLPLVFQLLVGSRIPGWHVGHVFNPFSTVIDGPRQGGEAGMAVGLLATLAVAVTLPSMLRGFREVMAASAARRAHAD